MHLLVLSAFRPGMRSTGGGGGGARLNAPFGAQCFPTYFWSCIALKTSGLNAPFGAQCFPT